MTGYTASRDEWAEQSGSGLPPNITVTPADGEWDLWNHSSPNYNNDDYESGYR